jgi:ATP-dependent Lon protease
MQDQTEIARSPAGTEQDAPQIVGMPRERRNVAEIPGTLSVLPIRGMVVFPGAVLPLSVRREKSLKLLEETLPQTKVIALVAQRDEEKEEPGPDDLHRVGVAVNVLKLLRQADDSVLIVVQALRRIAIESFVQREPYLRAEITALEDKLPPNDTQWQAKANNLRDSAARLIGMNPELPEQVRMLVRNIEDPAQLTDFLAGNLSMDLAQKQQLLEEVDVARRVEILQQRVSNQIEIAEIQQKLQHDVESHFTDTQRRAYLREQLRAIQRELGETEGPEEQIEELRKQLEEAQLPEEVMAQAERELNRLNYVPSASPEYSVIVGYLETLAELPWQKFSEDKFDLDEARKILDRDHYDLEKVKRRLIEYLAVRKLNPQGRGPILCFLGPPGVGKTSLGESIANSLGRKFSRMSLGGIRDEAEIRGHRRTYIGAMPGRIIQELRRVGTRNPVLMLDEVDKIGADFRGDPASALLEVLDPRQNHAFVDRYLDVPFDLSQIIFIATANYIDPVPPALRDRMEIIRIPGYTEHEKLQIAKKYLVPRQLQENGLHPEQCEWTDEALEKTINDYTHEAGVRELERQIAAVCRSVAAKVARDPSYQVTLSPSAIAEILGPPQYIRETRLKTSVPGVVTGLAYTPSGGEILHVEAARFPGKGRITLNRTDWRSNERICPGCVKSRPDTRRETGVISRRIQRDRHSRACAERSCAERWSLRWSRDVHGHRFAVCGDSGAIGCRNDWRNNVARPCAANRRVKGENARRVASRHSDRHHTKTERKGRSRSSGRGEGQLEDRAYRNSR